MLDGGNIFPGDNLAVTAFANQFDQLAADLFNS